jgi:hypothetical protein
MTMDRLFDLGEPDEPEHRRVSAADIDDVFHHWIAVHHRRGPRPQLSTLRRRRIRDAIAHYGMTATFAAIDGCAKSPWHCGDNPSGRKYNDIALILRDASHIERFADYAADTTAAEDFLRDT